MTGLSRDRQLKMTPLELVTRAYSDNSLKYQFARQYDDLTRHQGLIQQLQFEEVSKRLFVLQEKSRSILVYTAELGTAISHVKTEGQILHMALSNNSIAIVTSQRRLTVFSLESFKRQY